MGAFPSKHGDLTNKRAVPELKDGSVSFFSSPAVTSCDAPPPPPALEGGESSSSSSSLPPPPSGEEDAIAKAAAEASAYTSPGPFEHATMDAKRLVTLDTYDGFRCDINKQLSPYMAVVHSFWLGTSMIPDGRNKTYTWLTQVATGESLYMARWDPSKPSIDGRIHQAILGGAGMLKLQLGLSSEGQTDQALAEMDLGGMSWTANLKYGSMGGGLVYGCNFYQAITPNFAMGGEGMYIAANQNLISNYMLKYTIPCKNDEEDPLVPARKAPAGPAGGPPPESPASTIFASFNSAQGMVTLNYKRVVTPSRVTLGAELAFSPMTLDSQVLLGGEFKFARSKLQVAVDGSGHLQSLLETKLGKEPGQPSLILSADLNHLQDQMRFGYGLQIDG